MQSVTSVSGGGTSSYLALNFPTQHNIFSLVRIEDKSCAPKDKGLIQYVEDKIQMPFIATAESDLTLNVLRQLEQDLGKAIIWVTGETFEQVIKNSGGYLPNRRARFCTSKMKMDPIFWWCYFNLFDSIDDEVEMNIGYRSDEPNRKTDDFYKFTLSCNTFGQKRQNHKEIEWRTCKTPLRTHNIDKFIVKNFFLSKPKYVFPEYSNCVGCFNKTEKELQEQFYHEAKKMQWFKNMESKTGNTFNMNISLAEIEQKEYTQEQIDNMLGFPTCNCHD